eukprot:jgi/Psemu1/12527/gm1.12527_g
MSCNTCANLRDAEVRCERKKEVDLGNRLQPHSKVKMSALSPFSQWQRAQGLVHRQKIWTQKVRRMKLDVCEAKEEQMVAINSDEAKSLLQAAFGCIGTQEERSEFKQSILEVLMKADKHKNDQDKMDGNEISLFTSQICEMLDAESHKLSGNNKQVRYDYQMKRLALAYFLDYGKFGCSVLKESSLEILPSQRTNKRELSYLRGGDGAHAVQFSAQFSDALQDRKEPVKGEMFVQIIFDEIKVRCGVVYNQITGKETGFTASKNGATLSFAEEILSIVEDNLSGKEATTTSEKDKDPYFEPATYAKVFRARTARNQTFNVAYFFNSGCLDGDDVLRQLLHVIVALGFVGFKVMMQMPDAGGANTSALALLTSNKCNRLPHGKPPVASVAYTNPLAPSRLIYAPFCSVHGLKHSKNMLAYRLFLVNEGNLISWKEVIALYHHLKENYEYSMNVHELRGLRRSVAYPDKFTQQNVNDAKKAFEEETFSYQCQWLANKIGCTPDFFDKLLEEFQNKDGCGDEILEGKVQLLKDKLSTLPAGTGNKVKFENTLAFIEISVIFHVIVFIVRFLNKDARLVLTEESQVRDSLNGGIVLSLNVDQELVRMEKYMKYFDEWKEWSKSQKCICKEKWGVKKWSQLCMSNITLGNMKVSIFAFLYYAKEILTTGRGTSQLLEKGMIESNMRASTRFASSSSYSSHHSMSENCNLYKSEFDLTAGPKQREKWVKDLTEEMRAISMSTDISEIQKVSIFPHDMTIDDKMNYSEVLMDNDAFKDYAAASMLTQGIKEWFKKIILGQAHVMFDSLCQKIGLELLKLLVETAEERKRARSKRAAIGISFHMKLFKMLQHRNMNGVISGTTSDEERRGIASIVLILNEEMKKKQRKDLVKYAESKMAKDIEEEESESGLQLRKEIDFLSSMRFYAEEALQSQVYLNKCYDSFLRSSNRGRLTLVNEQYFHFGVMLIKKVSASVDQEKLGNDPDVTANAEDDILKNDELLEVSLDCSKCNVYLGKLSEKKKIFAELVDKVINARFSEEIRAYREEHAARGTKYEGTNLTMREEIDVIS